MGKLTVAIYTALLVVLVLMIFAYLQTYVDNYLPVSLQKLKPMFSVPVPVKCNQNKEGLISDQLPHSRTKYSPGFV